MMRHYGQRGSSWSKRIAAWVEQNASFRDYILDEIRQRGPLLTSDFEDQTKVPWASGGWSSGRSVAYMLDYLWSSGQIFVAQRDGLKRWWDLAERVLIDPGQQYGEGWDGEAVTRDAAQKSLRALGIGRQRDIERHFIEKRYPHLKTILPALVQDGTFHSIQIDGWEGEWFIHQDLLPLLETIDTELMWDFYYRIEIYVPKAKRQYGYYVLPILYGDQLIGRVDPRMDHAKQVLTINAVYVEPTTRLSQKAGQAVARSIRQLGKFLAAKEIHYGDNVPSAWRDILRKSV